MLVSITRRILHVHSFTMSLLIPSTDELFRLTHMRNCVCLDTRLHNPLNKPSSISQGHKHNPHFSAQTIPSGIYRWPNGPHNG